MTALIALSLLATPALPAEPASLYDFKAKTIEGKEISLKTFKGKVVVVVNVASKCGLTPQYAGLEKMYRTYKDKGLVIVGFPANDFNGQEPGSDEEIKTFCKATYDVSFPMMSKVTVKGDGQSPIYKWLIENSDRPKDAIEWNFAKFVVGRDGKLIKRFKPQQTPDDASLKATIESALATK